MSYEQEDIFPPLPEFGETFGSGTPAVLRESYSEKVYIRVLGGANKFHFQMNNLTWVDRQLNKSFKIGGAIFVGKRFQCYKTSPCKFPNGKEASV